MRLARLHAVLADPRAIEHDDEGFHCPDCEWPYPSAFAAANCDCDED